MNGGVGADCREYPQIASPHSVVQGSSALQLQRAHPSLTPDESAPTTAVLLKTAAVILKRAQLLPGDRIRTLLRGVPFEPGERG